MNTSFKVIEYDHDRCWVLAVTIGEGAERRRYAVPLPKECGFAQLPNIIADLRALAGFIEKYTKE